jgi:hypothetical protein
MEQTIEQTQQWSAPSTTSMALETTTPRVGLIDPEATKGWAEIFRKSGLFSFDGAPEVQLAQAQVKILAGAEMGLQPFHAMQSLYIVKGHVFVSAGALGALINGSRYAKFVTKESTADKATIEFYRREGDKWELVHTQTYTWDEVPAARRSNPTYGSDRADMIWNRCMTKGGKKSFPELLGGLRAVEEAYDAADFQQVEDSLIPEDVEATPNVAAIPQGEIAADPVEPERQTVAATKEEKPKRKAKAEPKPEPDADLVDDALENETEGFSGPEPANREKGSITPETKAKVNRYYKTDATGMTVLNLVKAKGWSLGGTQDLSEYQGQIIVAVCEGRDEADVV